MAVVSCNAKIGIGGLGRHFEQVAREYYKCGHLERLFTRDPIEKLSVEKYIDPLAALFLEKEESTLSSPAFEMYVSGEIFDRTVAAQLPRGDIYHGFDGSSMHTLTRARELKYMQLQIEGGMSHINNVTCQWTKACKKYPIERVPMHSLIIDRFLREYELADVIWVSSRYSERTFLAEGIPPEKLRRRYLDIPPRFNILPDLSDDGIFRVVYTGFLSPAKGVPVLIEAFTRLDGAAELTLIGAALSEEMRHFLKTCQKRDPRISVVEGDPLPFLNRADVYVHPSYQEGFGYAPMEALAVGVPVIVTEDTGMKEYVWNDVNGYIVPTGEVEPILEGLINIRQRSLRKDLLASLQGQ